VKISTEKFMDAFATLKSYAEMSSDSSTGFIQFKLDGSSLRLLTMNAASCCQISGIEVEEASTVPSLFSMRVEMIDSVVKTVSTAKLEFVQDVETNRMIVKNGATYVLNYVSYPEESISMESLVWTPLAIADASQYIDKMTLFTAADSGSPALCGICIANGNGYAFNLYEGIRVEGFPKIEAAPFDADAASVFGSFKKDQLVEIARDAGKIYFRQGSIVVASRLYGDEYPWSDVDRLMGQSPTIVFGVRMLQLKAAVNRSAIFFKDAKLGNGRVQMMVSDGEVLWSVQSLEQNQRLEQRLDLQVEEVLEQLRPPDGLTLQVSHGFLKNLVRVFSDEIAIEFRISKGTAQVSKGSTVCFTSVRQSSAKVEA